VTPSWDSLTFRTHRQKDYEHLQLCVSLTDVPKHSCLLLEHYSHNLNLHHFIASSCPKNKQSFYYNKGTKELGPLEPRSTIRIHPPKYSHQWTQATVDKQVGVRSYQVVSNDRRVYHRNRPHLRLSTEVPKQSPPDIEVSRSHPGPLPLT